MNREKLVSILKREPFIKLTTVKRPAPIIEAVIENCRLQNYEPQLVDSIVKKIQKAVGMALSAHHGVVRKSGEPYIFHPYTVAYFLARIGMDADCVIAGLLHDTVEDTTITLDEIKDVFGETVANLVDGVTKATQIKGEEKQQVALQKLINFTKDDAAARTIYIKLFDRLHNMMTLDAMTEEKQKSVSLETIKYYVPLADRLGTYWLKEELESLAFYFGFKEEWEKINSFIYSKYPHISATIVFLEKTIRDVVANSKESKMLKGKVSKIYCRIKSYYSIYKKTLKRDLEIANINNILAFRIVLSGNMLSDCYLLLSAIHNYSGFEVINKSFRDYIAEPRLNHYRSLHTVIRHENFFVAIQICTEEMEKIDLNMGAELVDWLKKMFEEGLLDAANAKDFTEKFGGVVIPEKIRIFSPKCDAFLLPEGATLLDFAYIIHKDVGNCCVGGTVNGKKATINHVLQNNDEVKIETLKNQIPRKDWLSFVKTQKAKQSISSFLSKKEKEIAANRGCELLKPLFVSQGREKYFDNLEKQAEFLKIAKKYSLSGENALQTFFIYVANGKIKLKQIVTSFFNSEEIKRLVEAFPRRIAPLFNKNAKSAAVSENSPIFIKNIGDVSDYNVANCCQPIEGDYVVVHVSPTKGFILHKADCCEVAKIEKDKIENDVYWFAYQQYSIEFIIKLKNNKGALLELVEELTKMNFQIATLHLNADDAEEKTGNVYVTVKGSKIQSVKNLKEALLKRKSIIDFYISNIDY